MQHELVTQRRRKKKQQKTTKLDNASRTDTHSALSATSLICHNQSDSGSGHPKFVDSRILRPVLDYCMGVVNPCQLLILVLFLALHDHTNYG